LTSRVNIGVLWVERVPLPAFPLARGERANTIAAERIHSVSNWLHVPRIHASALTAEVIEFEVVRNGADQLLVDRAMRFHLTATDLDDGIACCRVRFPR